MIPALSGEHPLTAEEAHMVVENTGLLKWCASRVMKWHPDEDFDDLVARGVFGLMNAVRRFDPDRGFRFSTLAVRAITNEMTREIKAGFRQKRGSGVVPLSLDFVYSESGGDDSLMEYLRAPDDPEAEAVKSHFDVVGWVRAVLPEHMQPLLPVLMGHQTAIEAAHEQGVSPQAIHSRCVRACLFLRRKMENA